ncbi:MAG: DUF6118 family protein [Phenylobacterium sp.]|uniref:DUF6118 family protein n=1 Tax=Phenylobacterium sp. TaxID=1871053 RepID=UPI00273300F3|nr:DUF6118 family protein [Phenylobacterium sp.]MDP3746259.1 DUF6118 family protein [Phenylobacterium sp.]
MSDDPATAAFDHLRSEVTLLRRAIEGLSAQQPEAPADYAPTLAKLNKAVSQVGEHLDQISLSPALSLTPEIVATQLRKHASDARSEVHRELAQAVSGLSQATGVLTKSAGLIRTRDAQRRWLAYAALAGGACALIAWLGLSGPISRALPAAWQVPERMAAAALGQDRWAAGARLMRGAEDETWQRLRLGEDLMLRNADVIDACAKRAIRLKRSVACEVRIGG